MFTVDMLVSVLAVVGGVSLLFCSALCFAAISRNQRIRRNMLKFKRRVLTRMGAPGKP